jgi:hypothetical protein
MSMLHIWISRHATLKPRRIDRRRSFITNRYWDGGWWSLFLERAEKCVLLIDERGLRF